MQELTKQEMKNIIGLEIPTDLAFLYNMTHGLPALHSEKQISHLSSKIYTQSLGFCMPTDINNFIFTNFTESHFQQHLFVAKREPINHPFLIKTREQDYKQAIALFKLVLRFMYDAHMSEQKEVLLGNYIIQQVLSAPALRDELFVQICVQMWARHQSDTSRIKIAHLMSMCLSVIAPSQALYKYLLKFVSDHAYNEFKIVCQHKLLSCFSVDYPTPRYYPPTLMEWQASRKKTKMALAVQLPKGNVVNCHLDSWTTGEDCARLALCACGLFENRHGWTVQLHDDNSIYELGGNDYVLDLIGEIEVPPGIPHNVAPFLVSAGEPSETKHRPSKHARDRPHRPDINRQPSFEISESLVSTQSGLGSSILSMRDNLRIVPKPGSVDQLSLDQQSLDQESLDISTASHIPDPPQISLQQVFANRPQASKQPSSESTHNAERPSSSANGLANGNPPNTAKVKSHSRLNERPLNVDLPGMARKSFLNSRYIGEESTASRIGTSTESTASFMLNGHQSQPTIPSITIQQHNGVKPKKSPSVTFRDQQMHPISKSQLNGRYNAAKPNTAKPNVTPNKAMSAKANLNSRYIGSVNQSEQHVKLPEDYWSGVIETPRYAPPSPLESSHSSGQSESLSPHPLASASLSVQEAPKMHQDIMLEINQEIQGISSSMYGKRTGQADEPVLKDDKTSAKYAVIRKSGKDKRRSMIDSTKSNISDLDDWVDKVFDPIIQDDAVNSLSNANAVQRSLKGNSDGNHQQDDASLWIANLTSPISEFTSLQRMDSLRQCLKGVGIDDADSNNNDGSVSKITGGKQSDSQTRSLSGSDKVGALQAQLQNANMQNLLLQQSVDNERLPRPGTSRKDPPAPKKVGKVVWPPVKDEPPKPEKQVGRLLIEEAHSNQVEKTLDLTAKKSPAFSTPASLQKPGGTASSLSERLQLLEKKIGERPPPSNPVVQKLASPSSQTVVNASRDAVISPVKPIEIPSSPSKPSTPLSPLSSSSAEPPVVQTEKKESRVISTQTSDVGPSKETVNVADVPDYGTDEPVSDRLPVRGVFQLLASVRTSLHADPSLMTYLTYSDVPWWLSIRKEMFSPNERLSNPKTIDLIFYQIVRDVLQYPCMRISKQEYEDMKRILGEITVQTMMDQNISKELKWNVIKLARSWPFYFARIFVVTGERLSDIQILAVSHDGVRFGKRDTDSSGNEQLVQLHHILYEDISQLKVPKEDAFHLTAEHKTYKVYTPKAGCIANLINAYGVEDMEGGDYVEAVADYITCEPGHLSYKKGDIIKVKPDKMSFFVTALPAERAGWIYGSFNGRLGSCPEDTVKPIAKRELSRTGSFQDTRSRHSSGLSEGEPSQSSGKFSMLEFSMMYYRENLDRYSTKPNEMGINGNIKLIENLKLSGLKRRKSISKPKESDKLQRQESWSWKEQADMIKWTKTPIPASLLKLPTDQMNGIAVDCFYSIQQFMGDQAISPAQTDIDCAFKILKACHQCPELKDEIYCQLSRQTTNNKSPHSQSCLRGWRLFTLVACWFSPSDVLKPFLLNYLQQNASDPTRPYHSPAHNCLQMLRKTIKYGGRKNVPSAEEIAAITDGKLNKRQTVLLPGGVPFILNITPSTVVQDVIDEICAKLGVVSQMEQDEYTVFAMVETDNEYARLKREEYVMDVVTEMRLQRKDCVLMFERTSWYFPLRLESASNEYLDMMFNQCIPDYIDGYLLTLDHKNKIPPRQLDDIIMIAALLYRASSHNEEPQSLKEIDNYLPGPILSLGLLKHQQFFNGVQSKLARLINFNSVDCKIEAMNMLRKWPLFGASFFNIQCLTEPKITGECLMAVNRAGIHFLHHKTHRVILSYHFTEVISSRKISSDHKLADEQFLDIKVGNNMVQKVVRVETSQGSDIAHLIGQYIKAVNSSAKLSL